MLFAIKPIDEGDPQYSSLVEKAAKVRQQEGVRHWANTPPVGWKEVTQAHIVKTSRWGSWHPDSIEFRQFPIPRSAGREFFENVMLYHYWDGTGVGTFNDIGEGRVRWFIFGCVSEKHNIHHCPDCGHSAHFDSSG